MLSSNGTNVDKSTESYTNRTSLLIHDFRAKGQIGPDSTEEILRIHPYKDFLSDSSSDEDKEIIYLYILRMIKIRIIKKNIVVKEGFEPSRAVIIVTTHTVFFYP
jgi:hypothetical protein